MKTNDAQYQSKRKTGILMPVSSLPSDCGIGTLGAGAYAFVDWLARAGVKIWQVLPLVPTGYGDSPYQSCASDALNPYFIDFAFLVKDGLLQAEEYTQIVWQEEERRVDYGRQFAHKIPVLEKAFARFSREDKAWKAFLKKGKYADYALFMSLKRKFDYAPWTEWEEAYKNRDGQALQAYREENAEEIEFWQFTQYIFLRQWQKLREYARENGVQIMGDMPIYVSADSVEVWKHRDELFMMDSEGKLSLCAGVPPDAFCDDGQLWGNPVYDWEKMQKDDYAWWRKRIAYSFSFFDIVRIDHFRAFDRFYAVPYGEETAKNGEWLDGPKSALFKGMENYEIVAEDLGVIDDGVRELLAKTGYPGMKVFEFAFNGDSENEYLPSNYEHENCVAYTGTHDNEPLRAFIEGMEKKERKAFEKALEDECLKADVPYLTETIEDECASVMELLMSSKAQIVIFPFHDALCMGEEARLNAPATLSSSNWTFRFTEKDFKCKKAAWLKTLGEIYDR